MQSLHFTVQHLGRIHFQIKLIHIHVFRRVYVVFCELMEQVRFASKQLQPIPNQMVPVGCVVVEKHDHYHSKALVVQLCCFGYLQGHLALQISKESTTLHCSQIIVLSV